MSALRAIRQPTDDARANGRRILAVDDELQIRRALKVVLRDAGYAVVTAANVEEALDVAAVSPVDAAIVELLLPDADGIELCRRLREWSSMPIIILSATSDEDEQVRALRSGADDFVTKPFGPRELVARVEAVLRRAAPRPDQSVTRISGLEVDLAAHVVRRDGEIVHLTPTEFALMRVFVCNRGRLLTHRTLLTEVWGPQYADDVTVLRGQIANLRRKLESPEGVRHHYLSTEPGLGYRFDPKYGGAARPGGVPGEAARSKSCTCWCRKASRPSVGGDDEASPSAAINTGQAGYNAATGYHGGANAYAAGNAPLGTACGEPVRLRGFSVRGMHTPPA